MGIVSSINESVSFDITDQSGETIATRHIKDPGANPGEMRELWQLARDNSIHASEKLEELMTLMDATEECPAKESPQEQPQPKRKQGLLQKILRR